MYLQDHHQHQDSTYWQHQSLISGGHSFTESECKLYLIVTLSVALTFCVLSAVVVFVACIRRCQEVSLGYFPQKI